ncbi:MAG: helix-turn-helix transcriptional regulator [Balneolaceae bacterium]
MNEISDIDWVSMSDRAILEKMGSSIRERRLEQNQTQHDVAAKAGISRSTLSMLERGEGTHLTNLIRVLRVLDLLYVLDAFETGPNISPIELARLEREKRRRARTVQGRTGEDGEEWKW